MIKPGFWICVYVCCEFIIVIKLSKSLVEKALLKLVDLEKILVSMYVY